MSRARAALSGGATMLVQVVVRMLGVLVVGHILSKRAGGEMLGAYSAMTQLILLIQLMELGLSQAILRDVAQLWEHPGAEGEQVRRTIPRASLTILLTVGIAISIGVAVAALTLPRWFQAAPEVQHASSLALAVAAAWMPLRFSTSFFSLFLFARQRIAHYSLLNMGAEVMRVSLTVTVVLLGFGLPAMMLATVLSEAANFAAAWWLVRRDVPFAAFRGPVRMAEIGRLVRIGVPIGMISLGERLGMFSQDLVVGAVSGARAVSEFYSTRMPGFLVSTVLVQLLYTLAPGLNDLYGREMHGPFRRANLRLVTYTAGVGLWAAAGIVTFTPALVSVWVGPDFYMGLPVTAAVAIVAIVAPFNTINGVFAMVVNRTGTYSRMVVAEGVISIAVSFVVGRMWGPAYVMWATAIAQCVNVPYLAWLSGSFHGWSAGEFLRHVGAGAVRCAGAGVLACALYVAAARAGLALHPFVALALAILVGGIGFLRLGLFPEDRALVGDFVRRKVLRRVAEQAA